VLERFSRLPAQGATQTAEREALEASLTAHQQQLEDTWRKANFVPACRVTDLLRRDASGGGTAFVSAPWPSRPSRSGALPAACVVPCDVERRGLIGRREPSADPRAPGARRRITPWKPGTFW